MFFHLTQFRELGQKYRNIFVRFLVQMKTLNFAFEINWPLHLQHITLAEVLCLDTCGWTMESLKQIVHQLTILFLEMLKMIQVIYFFIVYYLIDSLKRKIYWLQKKIFWISSSIFQARRQETHEVIIQVVIMILHQSHPPGKISQTFVQVLFFKKKIKIFFLGIKGIPNRKCEGT